jgi:hypothetical protein
VALPEGLDAVDHAVSPPSAPWSLALEGLVWLHRAPEDAGASHQPGLAFDRSIPLTVAGFARYLDSPVGAYAEVWSSPTLVVRGRRASLSVAFMAVDSVASQRGGRANWALPKVLATFGPRRWEATGRDADWTVRARLLSQGPRVPLWARGHLLQAAGDGRLLRSRAAVRGTGRPARVDVEVSGASAPRWLSRGRHIGFVIDDARLVVGAPRSLEGR